jgi:hypothetical protein
MRNLALLAALLITPLFAFAESAAKNSLSFSNDRAVNTFKLESLRGKGPQLGTAYTIDTRDQQTCREIQKNLKLDERLCAQDSERPYATVTIFHQQDGEIEYGRKIVDISNAQLNNTRNVILIDLAAFALLLAKPAHETHWYDLKWGNARERYFKNITSAPVFDKDSFTTNFIEHPLAGSVYYSMARHSGSSVLESFSFSVICSTFLWEYGLEAIPERPSINDMFVTPILGSLIGELSYQLGREIEANDGRLLGSPALGTAARVITDPGYFIAQALDQALGVTRFQSAGLYWVVQDQTRSTRLPMPLTDPGYRRLMMQLKLKF